MTNYDRRTFIQILGLCTLSPLLGSSQDGLTKKISSIVGQRAKAAGISIDEKLTDEVATNITDNYSGDFILENLNAISLYIINMNLSGWTHESYSDYKTRFEDKLRSAEQIPDNVLKKSIAVGFSKAGAVLTAVPEDGGREMVYVNYNYYGKSDFYLATADVMSEHELRHFGLYRHYTGNFRANPSEYFGIMLEDIILKCSEPYKSRFKRDFEEDYHYLAGKYQNPDFEKEFKNEYKRSLMAYSLEEMMVAGTGDINVQERKIDDDEKLLILLVAADVISNIPFAESAMLNYAAVYAIVTSLGADSKNNEIVTTINQRVSSLQNGGASLIKADFDLMVNVFQAVFEMANRNYKGAFRLH